MSDEPFFPGRPRLMSPAAARDIARGHEAMARLYEEAGERQASVRSRQDSLWWLAYAMALAQTKGGEAA